MGIQVMNLSSSGATPQVNVLIGNANLASYTIAMMPPNMDFSQAQSFFDAETPQEVDAAHALPDEWVDRNGWFIVVVGGIGGADDPPTFTVQSTLSQSSNAKGMTTTLMEGSSAAQFVSSIQLAVTP